jgi:hypothetical protein
MNEDYLFNLDYLYAKCMFNYVFALSEQHHLCVKTTCNSGEQVDDDVWMQFSC